MSQKASTIALTTILIAVGLPRPQLVQAQAIPYPVQLCYATPACIVGSALVGGVLYYTVTQGGHTTRFPMEGEYLENPEGDTEEWDYPLLADNPQQAEALCRAYAQRVGAVYRGVQRRSSSGRTYDCQLRTYRS